MFKTNQNHCAKINLGWEGGGKRERKKQWEGTEREEVRGRLRRNREYRQYYFPFTQKNTHYKPYHQWITLGKEEVGDFGVCVLFHV